MNTGDPLLASAPRFRCSGECVGRWPNGIPIEPCTFATNDADAAYEHFERTCHALDEYDAGGVWRAR